MYVSSWAKVRTSFTLNTNISYCITLRFLCSTTEERDKYLSRREKRTRRTVVRFFSGPLWRVERLHSTRDVFVTAPKCVPVNCDGWGIGSVTFAFTKRYGNPLKDFWLRSPLSVCRNRLRWVNIVADYNPIRFQVVAEKVALKHFVVWQWTVCILRSVRPISSHRKIFPIQYDTIALGDSKTPPPMKNKFTL